MDMFTKENFEKDYFKKDYFESEGIRFMELGDDARAKDFLEQAARLGSERAVTCLQYLNLNVCDDDFKKADNSVLKEEPFDYDLQPQRHVSYARTLLRKAFQSARNRIEYAADDFLSRSIVLIRRMTGSFAA